MFIDNAHALPRRLELSYQGWFVTGILTPVLILQVHLMELLARLNVPMRRLVRVQGGGEFVRAIPTGVARHANKAGDATHSGQDPNLAGWRIHAFSCAMLPSFRLFILEFKTAHGTIGACLPTYLCFGVLSCMLCVYGIFSMLAKQRFVSIVCSRNLVHGSGLLGYVPACTKLAGITHVPYSLPGHRPIVPPICTDARRMYLL